MEIPKSNSAFSVVFPYPDISKPDEDWALVGRDTLSFSPRLPIGYTVGQKYMSQQRSLVNFYVDSGDNLSRTKRLEIAKRYYKLLADGEYKMASEYVNSVVNSNNK